MEVRTAIADDVFGMQLQLESHQSGFHNLVSLYAKARRSWATRVLQNIITVHNDGQVL
jgi:hypothetical protein